MLAASRQFLIRLLSRMGRIISSLLGAKIDLSIYLDDNAAQSQGYDLCNMLGEPIARSRITLGGNTFVDEYMINLDVSVAMAQSPKNSMSELVRRHLCMN
jgi:hypothetical protein